MKKILVIFFFALTACFQNPSTAQPQQPQERTTLRVQNQGFTDMTIYLLRGGERVRLGSAGGLTTVVLTIPANVLHGPTSLRFLADPLAGPRQPVTEELTVSAGDEIAMIIRPQ